jgi:hypothetical protein
MIKLSTYAKLLCETSYDVLHPRRSPEERNKRYKIAILKKIKSYINNGSVGDLDLSNTPITSLPNNLRVGGNLFLNNTPISSLPDNLHVGGIFSLVNTKISSLPDNLRVGGYLNLRNTPISKKYTRDELHKMLPNVKGIIFT